ncbi:hypothetical protein NQZ68_033373 [Dissostichus eleginoides]|nr:hypothetical protein NQZ68_033373 [Dissostichus eleginoides]
MSLQIQNGEHVRSHTAAQSEGRCTGHPTWGIPCWDWPPWLNSSRSTRLVRAGPSLGSRVLVSVHSLCVVQRAAEELGMPNSKLVRATGRRDALRLGITGVLKDSPGAKKCTNNRNCDGNLPPLSLRAYGFKRRILRFLCLDTVIGYLCRREGRNQPRQRYKGEADEVIHPAV